MIDRDAAALRAARALDQHRNAVVACAIVVVVGFAYLAIGILSERVFDQTRIGAMIVVVAELGTTAFAAVGVARFATISRRAWLGFAAVVVAIGAQLYAFDIELEVRALLSNSSEDDPGYAMARFATLVARMPKAQVVAGIACLLGVVGVLAAIAAVARAAAVEPLVRGARRLALAAVALACTYGALVFWLLRSPGSLAKVTAVLGLVTAVALGVVVAYCVVLTAAARWLRAPETELPAARVVAS